MLLAHCLVSDNRNSFPLLDLAIPLTSSIADGMLPGNGSRYVIANLSVIEALNLLAIPNWLRGKKFWFEYSHSERPLNLYREFQLVLMVMVPMVIACGHR